MSNNTTYDFEKKARKGSVRNRQLVKEQGLEKFAVRVGFNEIRYSK